MLDSRRIRASSPTCGSRQRSRASHLFLFFRSPALFRCACAQADTDTDTHTDTPAKSRILQTDVRRHSADHPITRISRSLRRRLYTHMYILPLLLLLLPLRSHRRAPSSFWCAALRRSSCAHHRCRANLCAALWPLLYLPSRFPAHQRSGRAAAHLHTHTHTTTTTTTTTIFFSASTLPPALQPRTRKP